MGEQMRGQFRVGVNYWPRRKAMYWWKSFDSEEVKREFDEIAALNLDLIRIFLLWEDFQPDPVVINHEALTNLVEVLDTAVKRDLCVMPTLFTGHMSGVNWVPPWLLGGDRSPDPRFRLIAGGEVVQGHLRDLYADPKVLEAQIFLIETVVTALRDHPALFGWDLANEHDNLLIPRTSMAGKEWAVTLTQAIKAIDPTHPVTIGIHAEDLERNKGFLPQDMALVNDFLSMHGYALFSTWGGGPQDSDVVPFLCRLTQALGGRGKPVFFTEFGLPSAPPGEPTQEVVTHYADRKTHLTLLGEEEGGQYYSEVLEKLYRVGATGALAWCFSDYDPRLWSKPPLDQVFCERSFGLTRADGSLKPMGRVLADFAAQPHPLIPAPPPLIPPYGYYDRPEERIISLYQRLRAAKEG